MIGRKARTTVLVVAGLVFVGFVGLILKTMWDFSQLDQPHLSGIIVGIGISDKANGKDVDVDSPSLFDWHMLAVRENLFWSHKNWSFKYEKSEKNFRLLVLDVNGQVLEEKRTDIIISKGLIDCLPVPECISPIYMVMHRLVMKDLKEAVEVQLFYKDYFLTKTKVLLTVGETEDYHAD